MKILMVVFTALFLAGCASTASKPQPQSYDETISPMAYQECIQAAMTGNGQASNEKCDEILKASR
ncbi:ChiQ/YbfN family lipoprotein [Citrobacter murliniae]